jgi:hypothetical protein
MVISPLWAAPKPGDAGTPEFEKATTLVKQLASPRFADREAAVKQLVAMEAAAIPALTNGSRGADEEVRNRCLSSLMQIRQIARNRRLEAYLADREGKQQHDLPLLLEWRKVVEKPDDSARRLYAEMLRCDGELLEQANADHAAVPELIKTHCRALVAQVRDGDRQKPLEIGQLAAVFFVQMLDEKTDAFFSKTDHPAHLLPNPGIVEGVKSKELGPAFRRLLGAWGTGRHTLLDDAASYQFFGFAVHECPFPEAVPTLVRAAKGPTHAAHHIRGVAIAALGKIGDQNAKAALAGMVDDRGEFFRSLGPNKPFDCRIGDHAFAALLAAEHKKPEDYGLVATDPMGLKVAAQGPYVSIAIWYFPNPDARQKGIEKWKSEQAAKKDK